MSKSACIVQLLPHMVTQSVDPADRRCSSACFVAGLIAVQRASCGVGGCVLRVSTAHLWFVLVCLRCALALMLGSPAQAGACLVGQQGAAPVWYY
jgi:hypothetical protein